MRKLFFGILLSLIGSASWAQNEVDALRYSYITGGGTARYMGLGGAFGAVGADLSVASTNPAGLARYSKSELTITPGYQLGASNSTYNGSTTFAGKNNLNLTNAGFVVTSVNDKPDISAWKSVQFAFTYNKLHNFHTNTTITGESPSSITHAVANLANGYSFDDNYYYDPFFMGLFLWDGIVYESPDEDNVYYSMVETDVIQSEDIKRSGQVGETTLSLSGNYDDIIYVGATLGIQKINYLEEKTYREDIINQEESVITDLTYKETLDVTGRGLNLKLGAIYLPTDWLRFGVAFHTPTAFNLGEQYYTNLETNDTIAANPTFITDSDVNNFSYKIRTPARTILSAAAIINKKGLVSVDYELNDPTTALLKGKEDNVDFSVENDAIKNNFQPVNVIRVGTEWQLNPNFVARGGVAFFNSPIKEELIDYNANRKSISIGLGYRQKNFFLDVAFISTSWTENYYMYDPALIDAAKIDYFQNQLLATFGFRF